MTRLTQLSSLDENALIDEIDEDEEVLTINIFGFARLSLSTIARWLFGYVFTPGSRPGLYADARYAG
jgi:hypothetical protein